MLAHTNVHRLLMPGKLPTHELPKRLSLTFLLVEFSWRAPIPIADALLKNVCIFGGRWGAHSYCLHQSITKKQIFFKSTSSPCAELLKICCKIECCLEIYLISVALNLLLIDIVMCFFSPIDQQIENEGLSCFHILLFLVFFYNVGVD